MDRNSIIGLLLIGAVLIGYTYMSAPSEAEREAYKRKQDSIADVLKQQELAVEEKKQQDRDEALTPDVSNPQTTDSLVVAMNDDRYAYFSQAANGTDEFYTIENELIKATISKKGGRISSVELKEYKTFKGEPLLLFDGDSSKFSINFKANSRSIYTDDLYFDPTSTSVEVSGDDKKTLAMRLYANSKDKYIEYTYSLSGNSYLLDYQVNFVGLEDLVRDNNGEFGVHWSAKGLNNEKNIDNERNTSSVFYKYMEDEVDWLSETSDDESIFESRMQWFSFKQQYFSAALICKEGFDKSYADMRVVPLSNSNKYTKYFETNVLLPLMRGGGSSEYMSFYFGPNHFQTLKAVGVDLEDQINLGWGIIGWMNEYVVIPIFNFFDKFNWSYGIIILILTLIIKMALFPITYKNYLSSAKMRVLKPEIDELNEKNKNADPMKKQQDTMALYRKAGVNPMAGCIPALLQMPILYAMFRFFPSSIELRQEGFLWANDLSSYDDLITFPAIFGFDHISLFALLMAVSMFFYTRVSGQNTMAGGDQAQMMKTMMNLMPIMMFFIFNNFASGLNYYYFLANMITIGQTLAVKKFFIDEAAIHAKIQENKKKPQKKSNFQKRLEEMQKKQQVKK